MGNKQERLYNHAEAMEHVEVEDSPWLVDRWKAQAVYLDQHFIEREVAEQLVVALRQVEIVVCQRPYYLSDPILSGVLRITKAALETAEEE